MTHELKEIMRSDIALFAEKIHAFEKGEVDKKAYKGFSGGFGSYAQRNGGNMLRLRMSGGRLTKERLGFLAEAVKEYGVDRMKITTCQTIQFHNLSADATVDLMEKALDVDIVTRGGGGDFTRNAMASPLSGVEKDEYFDVLPWAEAAGEYMLGLVRDLHMPRKLKVSFSNGPANITHATFRDLGFAAREDGLFDVYCAGGLGPNPKMGVLVAEAAKPEDCAAYIDAMIEVFTAFGNYENRARSRTRYLQDTMGVDKLKEEFVKALDNKLKTSPKLSAAVKSAEKNGDGEIAAARVTEQKQKGLYAVNYHPYRGDLAPEKVRELFEVIKDMPLVEGRISPDGSIYFINLTASEAKAVLDVTADSAVTPFECSVSCIGGTICSTGIRDSQNLLANMQKAVKEAELSSDALPKVHVSGCTSSCGTQQIGAFGFQGGGKVIDGVARAAFTLTVNGRDRQGEEKFGEPVGMMPEEVIPAFIVELGKTVEKSGSDFYAWFDKNREEFFNIAKKYII